VIDTSTTSGRVVTFMLITVYNLICQANEHRKIKQTYGQLQYIQVITLPYTESEYEIRDISLIELSTKKADGSNH
jgi:hypothetical protein